MWKTIAYKLFNNWRHKQNILALARLPPSQAIFALAEAINTHPFNTELIIEKLEQLELNQDNARIELLWRAWIAHPTPALTKMIIRIGWPIELPLDKRLAQAILALVSDAQTIKQAISVILTLAHILPENDETINDCLYAAWIYSQSNELENLISEAKHQPGSPAMETLYALVTGDVSRYLALGDKDGEFLIQAVRLAPSEFLERMDKTVAQNLDISLHTEYRKALVRVPMDVAKRLAHLKLAGDEVGLYEQIPSLNLWQVLELCERWCTITNWFIQSSQKVTVEKILLLYKELKSPLVNTTPPLPDGMVDIFSYWCNEHSNEFTNSSNDPLTRARGVYLSQYHNLPATIELQNKHWIERLVTFLSNNIKLERTNNDSVCWLAILEEDIKLLRANIAGTPADYLSNIKMLQSMNRNLVNRPSILLTILCTLQSAFIGTEIAVENLREPPDYTAIRLEDVN